MQFYKEENFKKTEIGEIPEDWEVRELKDILEVIRNGLTAKQNKDKIGYPITRIETISDSKIDITKLGYVEDIKQEDIAKYRLIIGDILFSHINSEEHIGKVAIYEGKPEFLLHGMNLLLLRPNKNKIEPYYLLYLLRHFKQKNIFKYIAKRAVNQSSINQTQLKHLKIPLPPLEEQKQIAKILSDFDNLIGTINKQIEVLNKAKKGMMKKLFTKGVFEHKSFKKSEIGEIPEDWEVVELGNEKYFKIIMGQSPPSSSYNKEGEGVPFLQGKAEFGNIYPNPVLYTNKPLKVVDDEDILISVRAPVGDVNIAPFKLCIGRGLAGIKSNKEKVDNFFVFYYLSYIKPKIEYLGGGAVFKAITKKDLESIKIPLPPLEEQKAIAKRLKAIDDLIEIKRKEKEQIEKAKKKIMNLLLTGKIRVKT
ncbi:TPA: restriction endonuclease subunit S [Methanocaldococcus jannaschii]|uniref:Restriction endonuclease subunit S n=1 Tax=Methanocaldococcus jannaschii TaxID=2190 RepID=A0A832WHL3_9EURY|nr:restriction endonuclease subunit S [Methanocaldococcus jannaschii]HII59167.1 restriction endonuclease subunit S [Methanocaldococcus jannaschii]